MQITFFQTSDPFRYVDMLAQTSRTVRRYCQQHGFGYESYIGVKRGFFPWQASFNRLYIFEEMISRGLEGWVVYMDADAYIVDLDFDLREYLGSFGGRAFVASPSGATREFWDINNGVLFVNISHPAGRYILRRWKAAYECATDQYVHACPDWYMGLDDQAMLHQVLQDNSHLFHEIAHSKWETVNSPQASFIRQYLRAMEKDLPTRVAAITREVDAILGAKPLTLPT